MVYILTVCGHPGGESGLPDQRIALLPLSCLFGRAESSRQRAAGATLRYVGAGPEVGWGGVVCVPSRTCKTMVNTQTRKLISCLISTDATDRGSCSSSTLAYLYSNPACSLLAHPLRCKRCERLFYHLRTTRVSR